MKRNKPMKWLYAFLAFLLVFASVPAYGVSAATLTVTPTVLEKEIKSTSGKTILLTLDTDWAHDFNTNGERVKALINSMEADVHQDLWNKYKTSITASIQSGSNNKILEVNLPSEPNYSLSSNQKITININGALLENWSETVASKSFEIIAEPKLLLGGTIFNATASDLRNGGKTIELKLVNAKWDETELKVSSNLKNLLSNFYVGGNTWSVIKEFTSVDPSKYLTFSSDFTTLTIALPPSTTIISNDKVELSSTSLSSYTVGDTTLETSTPSFNVFGDSDITITGTLDEESIIKENSPGNVLTLKLANGEWTTFDYQYKKDLLIDSLKPVNQIEAWNSIKEVLKTKSEVNVPTPDTLELTLKASNSDKYYLQEDQQLLLKVPSQLLKEEIALPEKNITIKAQPKVLVSGSATSAISYEDLIKGGKIIELTLVNTTWKDISIASNRVLLVDMFDWNNLKSDSTDIKNQVLEKALIVRNSDKKVTITLPSLSPFKLNVTSGTYPKLTINPKTGPTNITVLDKPETIFQVEPLDKVTAKITAPKGKTEFDVVKDGYSFTISLTNDKWISDVVSKLSSPGDTTISTWFGSNLKLSNAVRVSDTELKIDLISDGYSLTNNADAEYKNIVIPGSLLTLSTQGITATGDIKILDVFAELSGTAGSNIDAINLENGGKTIIITLDNANFKANLTGVDESRIINFSNTDLKTAFETAISSSDITIKGNKLTIKLPKIKTTASGSLSFKIPYDLIDHSGASNLDVKGSLTVGAKGEASISSSPTILKEEHIKNTGNTTTLTITLSNAKWDPSIASNKTKQNTLLKGFAVDGQEEQWEKVIEALKNSGTFTVFSSDTVLTIKLPKDIDYSIIRDQVVTLKIPKSVLVDYKYDIDVPNTIKIESPTFTSSNKTFTAFLPELSKLSGDAIAKTRVRVPAKELKTVQVTNVAVPESGNITTVVVNTSNAADITATIISEVKNQDGTTTKTEVPQEKKGTNNATFIFTNVDPKSELKVTVKVGNKVVGQESEKVGKGKKTYSYEPKKMVDGDYALTTLLSDDKLLKEIFKYYSPSELEVGTAN